MMLMTLAALTVLGLCLGSFINALNWRIYEQGRSKKASNKKLSILNGRSMCPHCKHELSGSDLVPVFSWLFLRGKCRYCAKKISWQYPAVEILTAALFILSYAVWPNEFDTSGIINFAGWLLILTGLISLAVYDIKWMILPDRVVYPLIVFASALAVFNIVQGSFDIYDLFYSLLVSAGLFFLLFQISDGKWIGGGDVKLGFLIGLVLASPFLSFIMLFVASTAGTIYSLPVVIAGKLKASARIPFGPFLIFGSVFAYLFGAAIIDWYKKSMGL